MSTWVQAVVLCLYPSAHSGRNSSASSITSESRLPSGRHDMRARSMVGKVSSGVQFSTGRHRHTHLLIQPPFGEAIGPGRRGALHLNPEQQVTDPTPIQCAGLSTIRHEHVGLYQRLGAPGDVGRGVKHVPDARAGREPTQLDQQSADDFLMPSARRRRHQAARRGRSRSGCRPRGACGPCPPCGTSVRPYARLRWSRMASGHGPRCAAGVVSG